MYDSYDTAIIGSLKIQPRTFRPRSELRPDIEGRGRSVWGIGNKRPLSRILAALIFCALFIPGAAQAASVQYAVPSGAVSLSVLVDGVVIGTASGSVSGSLSFDQAAESLDSLSLQLEPNIGITLSQAYGGFDTINIESATISSDTPFNSTLLASSAQSFTVQGSPLVVNGSYGASDSSTVQPSVSGVPITFPVPSITAVIGMSTISFSGITLNSISGSAFGEANDLVLVAQISVDTANLTAIPEPSTALLVSLGLGLLSASRRRAD